MSALLPLILVTTSTALPQAELSHDVAFLEQSLEGPKMHARIWWWGWLSVYAAAAIVQGTRLGLVDPNDDDAAAQRADLTISVIKALGGVIAQLAQPLNAMHGAEMMQRIPGEGPDVDRLRAAAGEAALAENARESRRQFWWLRHAAVVAVNLAHGLIVWLGYDDPTRAAISASLGFSIGELAIWTQPWEARSSIEEYRATVEAR